MILDGLRAAMARTARETGAHAGSIDRLASILGTDRAGVMAYDGWDRHTAPARHAALYAPREGYRVAFDAPDADGEPGEAAS